MRSVHAATFSFLLAAFFVGCSGESSPTTEPTSDSGGPGVLGGRVVFSGEAPAPRYIQVNKDAEHCSVAEGEVQDVVMSADGSLADAVIEIEGIEGAALETPARAMEIHQEGCMFSPRLLLVPDGTEVTIYNGDPVLHNINTGQWNIAQIPDSPPIAQQIDFQGRSLFRVNCNVHSWMESFIYVARSSYVAVTGPDGRYRIEDVPPGEYRVTATHPTLGTERFDITVRAGQTVEHDVAFQ